MEIRSLLKSLWRSKTGPLLVSAQVAITMAVLVNVAWVVEQRIEQANQPTGLDLNNMFWIYTQALSKDYNYENAVKADLSYLNSLPGVVAASIPRRRPRRLPMPVSIACCIAR